MLVAFMFVLWHEMSGSLLFAGVMASVLLLSGGDPAVTAAYAARRAIGHPVSVGHRRYFTRFPGSRAPAR
jgi:hypothetical protein